MTATTMEAGKIDIGRVLGETFSVIGRNFVVFAVLGLLLAGLPNGVMTYIQAGWIVGQSEAIEAGTFNLNAEYFAAVGYGVLVAMVTGAILQGALIHATVQDLNGQKPSIGASLAMGLRYFLPLIGLAILATIAIAFGFLLLIVPGLMLICAWCVAGPALVVDRTGVLGAFGRSAELTRGNRWRIFALLFLVWVLLVVVGAVLGAVSAAALFASPGALEDPAAVALNPLNIAINVLQQAITAVLFTALFSVLYVELRKAREGMAPQWLADVFS